ncbi:amino acid ABC transporter ATP-binding protein [Butyrivibrio sp. WCE2006]|uniref:amino acid ABC transporter ATP-binding protein n=1 Tax=Butyrivibrio sp. WCE2006 TaxID=1410611 RepID=UPI000A4B934B|nr:amino acid ABC transporter ATP-binding protein [Butyrivibrio sp. WCE2006]
MDLINIKNLTMDYGQGIILNDINLDVAKGETVFLIGGSGCGKSTLLRCINRLITPTAGEIYINGENILKPDADIDKIRRSMAMVFQSFNLFSHLNVIENLILAPMKVLNKSKEEAIEDARQILKRVGMSGRENSMPEWLSGGQKQRIAIARALAMHPDVILFDEPTSALDPTMVGEVKAVISDLCNEGQTSVIVTHDMNFARNTATKVVFLAEKGIYEQGEPIEFFDKPKKVLTKKFLYNSRMLERSFESDTIDILALASELRKFISRFQNDSNHDKLISTICDEFLYPIFNAGEKAPVSMDMRLICSETSRSHYLMFGFPDLDIDPLSDTFIDELNLKILEHQSSLIMSKKRDDVGYDVCIQM